MMPPPAGIVFQRITLADRVLAAGERTPRAFALRLVGRNFLRTPGKEFKGVSHAPARAPARVGRVKEGGGVDKIRLGGYAAEPLRRRGVLRLMNAEAQLASFFAKYEPAMGRLGKALRARLRDRLPGRERLL
jgi:hypothetical protein